ncbi:hypothetical protein D3C79_672890 [compost metagenome]
MAMDGGVAQVVGVVGMEHGAVDNRRRQVRGAAAVTGQVKVDPVQATGVVKTDVILDVEGVTFAGHQHVFNPRQTHLGRLAGEVGDDRAQTGGAGGLGFLAAKTTSHAAHIDDNLVHRYVEHFGNQLLDFSRVLSRAVDDHSAVFGRHHRRDLGLQVKMLLAADVQGALNAVRGARQGAGRVATLVGMAVEDEMFLAQRFDHIQHRFEVFVFDDCGHGGASGGVEIAGRNGNHRLADKLDLVDSQQRVARQQWADVFEAWNVFVGNGNAHAFEGIARVGIDAQYPSVGAVRQARIDVQLIGEFQAIVDVHRFTGYMLVGAIVLEAATDTGGQVLAEQLGHFRLAFGDVMVRHKRSPESRCAAFAVR